MGMHFRINSTSVVVACGATIILSFAFWMKRRKVNGSQRKDDHRNAEERKKCDGVDIKEKMNNGRVDTSAVPKKDVKEERDENFEKVLDSIIPREWKRVGEIKDLFIYPLKSGRGRDLKKCHFTDYGISIKNEGYFTIRDRMFLVYSEENGAFRTGRNFPTLVLVTLSAVDEVQVKLEAVGMPSLTFKIPENFENSSISVPCTMWWGEKLECIDCGTEVARWISRFLTGTNTGLRLGYAIEKRRNIMEGPWEKFTKIYDTLRNEDTGLFSDLASYMVMTESSVLELNQKLDRPVPALQFRPNVVISGPEPFAEDKWEWIKIGQKVVIRNVKPCPRCSMIYIDPNTGKRDNKEPMKTLRSFREQKDPKRIQVDGKAPTMGIYCGLYRDGEVKIGDDVYVHIPEETKKMDEEHGTEESEVKVNDNSKGVTILAEKPDTELIKTETRTEVRINGKQSDVEGKASINMNKTCSD